MEETLPIDYTCSETDDESGGSVMAAVGCLKVLAKDGEKERCYPVFKGTNTVGRSTSCQICIPIKAISKHHATILVDKDSHFLQDNNSKNHTRRNKVLLKSQAYYELSDNCDLLFGDCACIYYTGKAQWEAFVAKRDDDDSQTLCESVVVTTGTPAEEPLPITPTVHDPRVVARGSHDMTDALFSPDDMSDKTLPVTTEHTQLLLTTDADGPTVTNGSDSAGSSPLLGHQDNEATQLIPLEEIAAADHNETDGHDEPTIAYPIASTARSPSNSPMDDNDIDATIPYDMTQGYNLLTKCRSASNSPDAGDIENTIPYEMTQGVLGSNSTESPTSKRSPVDDVEPTVPYEMSDASSPGCDAVEGVAEPTVGVANPTVHTDEGVADPIVHIDEPTVGVADPTVGVADPTVHTDEPTVGVADPAVHTDEPIVSVTDPETHINEPTVGVADPAAGTDEPPAADMDEPTVGVASSTANMVNPADDLDETQSIDGNVPTEPITDHVVGVADAMDDNDATQTIDIVGVAEMDTGDGDTAPDQHAESCVDNDHIPPAASPTPSSPKTSPVHKTTPILRNVASPKSPTPKKVHFEPAKPPTLSLSTPPPSGSRGTVSLDDEESPDVELPRRKTLPEPHPLLSDDDDDDKAAATAPTTATATAPTTRGGARRKGKAQAKSEATRSTKTRSSTAEQAKGASNKDQPAGNKRGGAKNKSAASTKSESAASSKTRRNTTDKTKGESTAASGETSTAKGKSTAKKGRGQPSKRGGKRKAVDSPTDSDETPSVTPITTPITTPINESPSFLTDTDALFSGGGRIKRKYTDFLSPKRDNSFRNSREEIVNKKSPTESPLPSNDSASHDLPTTSHDPLTTSHDLLTASHDLTTESHDLPMESHDPSSESHDSPVASHNPTAVSHVPTTESHDSTTASHDPATTSHDPDTASHDPATASHDALPKVLFTGIVDEDGQKVVEELGGELVESVYDCTHLVTDDKLRRTLKLLCCISRGCPIISTQWLKKCKQQKKFVSAEPFIIKDKTFEKQRKCSLSASLTRARAGPPLLANQQFYITAKVQPSPSDMRDIIKCSGGEILGRMPFVGSDNVSIITCDADLNTCKAASEGGVPLYTSEYLLSGILRQQLDPESHRLIVKDEERRSGKNKRRASSSSSSNGSSTKRRRK